MRPRLVITGAAGWIGRVALATIPADDPVLVARTSRRIDIDGVEWSLRGPNALASLGDHQPTLVIHAGFPTQEKVQEMGESAYRCDVSTLRQTMLEALMRLGPVDLIYLSSGAATTVREGRDAAPRTLAYGNAKLDDERVFTDITAINGGRLCIIRAFALSGPYMTKPETYALGSMILQALRRGLIEVTASRLVRRSYMAIDDMFRIAMNAVSNLSPGEAITFETAGEVVEVGELADRVLRVLGCDPAAVARPALDPLAPADDYLGDPVVVGRLAAAAGVTPAGLDEQIAVTAAWLREEAGL